MIQIIHKTDVIYRIYTIQVKPATRTKQRKIAPNPNPSPNNTYLAQLLTTGKIGFLSDIEYTTCL